jgi:hypothetical protein
MNTSSSFLRRATSGTAALAIVLSSFAAFAVPSAQAADPNWDASGAYVLNFNYNGADYAHNVTLAQDASGELSGNGGSGAYAWVIDSGSVSGDDISFTAHYTATSDAVTPLTVMNVSGTISTSSMSGTWSDNYQGGARSGTWAAASGEASPIIVPVVRTITASAGANGSITPSGAVSVADGGDQSFAITPDTGFHVSDVLVDGASVGATTTYSFSAAAADHTISASFEADASEQPAATAKNRRNGGSGKILPPETGSGEVQGAATSSGEVEGAETGPSGCANGPLIASFMRAGADNDQEQVKLLQAFLSGEMGTTTPVTGLFDEQTEAAVKAFQLKYADEILAPWGISEPTGQVYLLTQWKINGIACPALDAPKPAVPPVSQSDEADEDENISSAAVAPVAGSVTLTDTKTDENAVSASGSEQQVAAAAAASTTASSTPGWFGRFVNWLFGK